MRNPGEAPAHDAGASLEPTKYYKIMKQIFWFILCLSPLVGCHAGDNQNRVDVAKLVAAAREQFADTRSGVEKSIEETLKCKSIASNNLDSILSIISQATNTLQKTAFIKKLDLAASQVETVRTRSVASLKDPDNKAMASGLDLQHWLDEIARLRSTGEILGGDLMRLHTTIQELRNWAALMEPVAPSDQVTSKLKSRLVELLNDWRGIKPPATATLQLPTKTESPTNAHAGAEAAKQFVLDAGQSQQLADEQQAQAKIQAAADAQENAALENKPAQSQQLADDRQQQAAADQPRQPDPAAASRPASLGYSSTGSLLPPRQPDPVFAPQAQLEPLKRQSLNNNWPSRPREDAVVDLLVRNGTPYPLFIKFVSPPDYVWPRPGRAFRAMPGESIRVALRGIAGQEIFLTATTPNNPYARWGSEDQPPIATCGEAGPVSVLIQ